MSGLISANRRNFLQAAGSGVAALAASQLGLIQSAVAQTATASPAPLGPIRQINPRRCLFCSLCSPSQPCLSEEATLDPYGQNPYPEFLMWSSQVW